MAQAPASCPGWKTIGCVVILGVVGTALAYLLFFSIIASAGAGYASFVTYLVPPIALAYGTIFLEEHIGAAALGGLVLILGGVALGTGIQRRRALVPAAGADVISLRRATPDDVDWLVESLRRRRGRAVPRPAAVPAMPGRSAPTSSARSGSRERLGRMIIEVDGERAGAMAFDERSEPNRIAQLGALAVHPDFRGRRVADEAARQFQRYLIFELGFHRLELACYGFNERAIQHAERVGFVREGVQRRAYLRHGEWQDAVLFSLLREDLD